MNKGSVCVPSAYLYERPDKNSPVTDEILYGTSVRLLEKMYGGFFCCETSYGYQGYVERQSISSDGYKPQYTVVSPFCDVLLSPEYRLAPTMTLPRGSKIEVTGEVNGRFTKVKTCNSVCYIRSEQIQSDEVLHRITDESIKRRQIVSVALSYLGTQYRYGGKSSAGIDCSGLCFMAYSICGLLLWRDALCDSRYVKRIAFDELLPADLIYYDGHVTMYIGKGQYIHSSATLGGVVISSFDENSDRYYPKLKDGIICCASSTKFS